MTDMAKRGEDYCHPKGNGGLSSARNVGVKAASADYIGFMDSDDYIESIMYETLYQMAEKRFSRCGSLRCV